MPQRVQTLAGLLEKGVQGRRVFVRADLNVPIRDGVVRDDTRIRASLPTLRKLAEGGARVLVASHLGRPKGKVVPELSLAPVAETLRELLGLPVKFVQACVGRGVEPSVTELNEGELLVLENLRFEPGEEANDHGFSRSLAALADAYVLDAFGTAHRSHASTVGMLEHMADSAMGELVESELRHLERLLDPERPFVCLLGGAKVSGKAELLHAMVQRADAVAIGGAMAYPFLDAKGECVGSSRIEADVSRTVAGVVEEAERTGCCLLLPVDHRVVHDLGANETPEVVKEIRPGDVAADIGPETAEAYAQALENAGAVFWNGPMGVFEVRGCDAGTRTIAQAIARCSGYTVAGGGETVEALRGFGLENALSHVSTGGGAALEFVAGKELPALGALRRAARRCGAREGSIVESGG